MSRFQHLAPEEITGAVLLVVAIAIGVLVPGPISQLFETPYSTPAPGGGPGRQIIPGPSATPFGGVGYRVIGARLPPIDRRGQ